MNRKQAIQAIRKAKIVLVNTRLTEHDMAYTKGIKADIICEINDTYNKYGVNEFNVHICSDTSVIIG